MSQIPSVDLRDFLSGDNDRKMAFVQAIGKAYQEIGFVALKGHFLSDELAAKQYASVREFFALPTEVKQKYLLPNGHGQRGYVRFGTEVAQGQKKADLKEFWHFGQFDESLGYMGNVVVEEIPDFNTNGEEIFKELQQTGVYVMRALALFLDLDENYFDKIAGEGNSILRSLHYPPLQEGQAQEATRAAAHTDINLITLLMGAQGRGLQVQRHDGEWVDAFAQPDELVINVGDMLSRMTNNRLKSTVHRVINPDDGENKSRYSMPFFMHARTEADLSVLPNCIDADHPKLFEDITAGDFLTQRLIEIGLLKKENIPAKE